MRQVAALLSFWQNGFASDHFRGGNCGRSVNLQSRRALLKQFAPQYGEASSAWKVVMLDPLPKPRVSSSLENMAAQPLRYVYDPARTPPPLGKFQNFHPRLSAFNDSTRITLSLA
jgi:hypothetical protein